MLNRPRRGVYSLTDKGEAGIKVDPRQIELEFNSHREQDKDPIVEHSNSDSVDANKFLPDYNTMIEPALQALRELGGRARKSQVSDLVAEKMGFSHDQLNDATASGHSRYGLKMDNVRRFFLNEGIITTPHAGTWELTEKGWSVESLDVAAPASSRKRRRQTAVPSAPARNEIPIPLDALIAEYKSWQEELFDWLHQLSALQWERFLRLIFQSEGIDKVDAIDAIGSDSIEGAMSSGGFLRFRVFFTFLRGSQQISSMRVSDFRCQAQVVGANKGLLITTGSFTHEARREADKRASPEIELIDGEQFVAKLKERELGVKTERLLVERITINPDFFANI